MKRIPRHRRGRCGTHEAMKLAQLGWIAVVAAAVACGGGSKANTAGGDAPKRPAVKAKSPLDLKVAEMPDAALVVAVVPNPSDTLARVNTVYAALDAPGQFDEASALGILGVLLDEDPIAGLDLTKPLYAILLDRSAAELPMVLMASVSDPAAFAAWKDEIAGDLEVREGPGVVAMGHPKAMAVAGDYAIGVLLSSPMPAHPKLTVSFDPVRVLFGAEIDAVVERMQADPSTTAAPFVADMFRAMVDQVDAITVSPQIEGTRIDLELGLVGRDGSTLARFAAAQRASTFEAIQLFDTSDAVMMFAGTMAMGELGDSLAKLAELSTPGAVANPDTAAAFVELIKLLDGELAMAMTMTRSNGSTLRYIAHAGDPRAVMKVSGEAFSHMSKGASGVRYEPVTSGELEYAGEPVARYRVSFDYDKLPSEQRGAMQKMWGESMEMAVSVTGAYFVQTSGAGAMDALERTVDSIRAGPVATRITDAVRASAARNESVLIAMDMARLVDEASEAPAPVHIGAGFSTNAAVLRISLTAESLAAMQRAAAVAARPKLNPKLVKDVAALADEGCACADMSCAEGVQAKLMARIKDEPEPTQIDQEAILRSLQRMGDCFGKLPKP